MKSKDYELLVNRLEQEVERNVKLYNTTSNNKCRKITKELVRYHEEMIKFIKKLDEEIW